MWSEKVNKFSVGDGGGEGGSEGVLGPWWGIRSVSSPHTHAADTLAHTGHFRNSTLRVRCGQCPVLKKLNIELTVKEKIFKESVICHSVYIQGSIQGLETIN